MPKTMGWELAFQSTMRTKNPFQKAALRNISYSLVYKFSFHKPSINVGQ